MDISHDYKQYGVIILAAGESKRMGTPKQVLPLKGSSLLQHSIETAKGSNGKNMVLVLGANYNQIYPSVANYSIDIVENKEWKEGMASSLRCGLKFITHLNPGLQGVVIILCDQPHITSVHINKLIEAAKASPNSIIISEYDDTVGAPALFQKNHFEQLFQLKGEEGAKSIIKAHKENLYKIPFPKGGIDIDTPEDYQKLKETF